MTEQTWRRVTGWAAVLVIVLALLMLIDRLDWLIRPVLGVLPPFVIAFLLAFLLNPILTRLEKQGVSRGFAVVIIGLVFVLVFVATALYLVPRVAEQGTELAQNLPGYVKQASERADALLLREKTLLQRLNLPTTASGLASRFSNEIRDASTYALGAISSFILAIAGKALWLVIIPLVTIFLLMNWEAIRTKAVYLTPQSYRSKTTELTGEVGRVLNAYIRGTVILAVLYGVSTAVILASPFFRLPYALILGLIAALASPIPFIGSAVILISTGIVGYAHNPSLAYVIALLVTMLFVNNVIFDQIVAPRVLGGAVGLSLPWTIFALMLGGNMFGIAGMLLAVPVGAIIQVVLISFFPKLGETGGKGRARKPRESGQQSSSGEPRKRRRKNQPSA